MLKTFLKEVVTIIVGKQAENIVDIVDGKKYVNEFSIAKKLGITINQTRNILYKIADQGLISSIRKKDKRKGWYTYFWRFEVLKSLEFLFNLINKQIEELNYQIKSRETKEFYFCELCKIEVNAERALLNDFTCNECGNVYHLKDNSKAIKNFKREEEKLRKKLKLIQIEMDKEQEKLNKKRAKEIKKEAEEKAKKRAEAAVKRKATRKKLERENIKKTKVKKESLKKKGGVKKNIVKKKPIKKKAQVMKKVVKKKSIKKKAFKKTKSVKKKK